MEAVESDEFNFATHRLKMNHKILIYQLYPSNNVIVTLSFLRLLSSELSDNLTLKVLREMVHSSCHNFTWSTNFYVEREFKHAKDTIVPRYLSFRKAVTSMGT